MNGGEGGDALLDPPRPSVVAVEKEATSRAGCEWESGVSSPGGTCTAGPGPAEVEEARVPRARRARGRRVGRTRASTGAESDPLRLVARARVRSTCPAGDQVVSESW